MKALNFFKALSDDTRLRLLHIFTHYELNVNEIVEIMGMGQSRISRHLKILADTQLLTFRRDGLWTFYTAAVQGEG
ncbi:MAG TPA: metalloregulator ArsR/SmtB family transcription factor, partial [Candidatus Deferrimicrobium sp.]|nr:metalloregulator ArsR/SmtB family transcription factor [Candidatus Deferrimicrobium sp.]